MTTLFLIRHGQTDSNRYRKYNGWGDPPLNAEGRRQAEKLQERLQSTVIDAVFASDLQRASQTARIVFQEKAAVPLSGLREVNFGVLEGLNYEQIMAKYADVYTRWVEAPWEVTLPEGEVFRDFVLRVRDTLKGILSNSQGRSIAVVSHSAPIRVILCDALGRNVNEFASIPQENCGLNIIEYHGGQAQVKVINDTGHL
jgi:alpha-ribazole phosphatase